MVYFEHQKKSIKSIKSGYMVITNYSFYSASLNQNTNSPSRWFIPNGGAYPVDEQNPFFKDYRNILIEIIKRKKRNPKRSQNNYN